MAIIEPRIESVEIGIYVDGVKIQNETHKIRPVPMSDAPALAKAKSLVAQWRHESKCALYCAEAASVQLETMIAVALLEFKAGF